MTAVGPFAHSHIPNKTQLTCSHTVSVNPIGMTKCMECIVEGFEKVLREERHDIAVMLRNELDIEGGQLAFELIMARNI